MANMRGPLGCAGAYQAQIIWRADGHVYGEPVVAGVTRIQWTRTFNDVSTAEVTISLPSGGPDCCGALADVTPWVHELVILRDGVRVWEGPIVKRTVRRDTMLLEAKDVFVYLDRLKNTFKLRYVDATPDEEGRRTGQVTWIAEHIIRLCLVQSSLSRPPDYPRIMDYIVRRDTSRVIRYEKDGSTNTAVWAEYVGNILRVLVARGLNWTTVGRSLVLIAGLDDDEPALARLGLNDIIGDIEVIHDGNALATASWAHNQDSQNISGPAENRSKVVGTGHFGTPYGRVEIITKVDDENPTDEDMADAARAALAGRFPMPVTIGLPDESQLHPDTPLGVNDLVPGTRIDVSTHGMCTELLQPFRLADVTGNWTEAAGEKITVSLVPPAQISGDTPAPEARKAVPS